MILLIVLGSLLLTCGVGTMIFLNSETGQKLAKGVSEAMALAEEAMNAPGTDELRQAGCSEPMVLQLGRMAALLESMGATEGPIPFGEGIPPETMMVICNASGSTQIACGDIASTYGGATDATAPFIVVSENGRGTEGSGCQGLFDATGRKLRDLEGSED